MVSSRDVAARAGVSQATVSRVLAGSEVVAPATRDRVLSAMRALGYVPNTSARAMKTGRTGTAGVVVADLTNPFYPQLLEELSEAFDAAGYRMTVWVADGPHNDAALQAIDERAVDGVVFTTATEPLVELRTALARRSPLVLVNRMLPDVPCDQVGSDNKPGGALVADYFLDHGRSHVAFIGGDKEAATTADRHAGFRERLLARGAPEPATAFGEYTHDSGFRSTVRLLRSPAPPAAIFCSNDLLAFGALDAARSLGVQVPGELWVIGYDDVAMASWPSLDLTTVRQDIPYLAEQAVCLLLSRISDPSTAPRRVLVPPELCLRGSTGRNRAASGSRSPGG